MSSESSHKRLVLGFKNSVIRSFGFLEEMGFHCVEATDYIVRYESPKVFVSIAHDRQSYEISATIGLKRAPDIFASVEELAQFLGGAELERVGNREAAAADSVTFVVGELGRLLREHGATALRGDEKVFARAREVRSRAAVDYTQSVRLHSALTRAEEAWQRKDYDAVVEILAPYQEWLSGAQAKRLAYARKRLD